MSNLTEFLILHQQSLGIAYTPVMTLYMLAVISPLWSAYLLLCSLLSLAPTGRVPYLSEVCLSIRLALDAVLNPSGLVLYYYLIPYYLGQSTFLRAFFYANRSGALSIRPGTYILIMLVAYGIWYYLNKIVYKRIKPGMDFHTEYLMSFYSPSRIFGSAGLLIVLFDFETHINFLLWVNVYIGIAISVVRYAISIRYAVLTSNFMMTNR